MNVMDKWQRILSSSNTPLPPSPHRHIFLPSPIQLMAHHTWEDRAKFYACCYRNSFFGREGLTNWVYASLWRAKAEMCSALINVTIVFYEDEHFSRKE